MWKAEAITSTAKDRQRFNLVQGCILIHTGEKGKKRGENSNTFKVFKRWLSFLGPQHPQNTSHDILSAQESLKLLSSWTSSSSSLYSHTPTIKREGDAVNPILNSVLTFAIFTPHFISVSFPCAGTLRFLLDGVFLIRSLLLSLAIGSLLNIFFELYIASGCTKHNNNNNDYKIITGCGGKKWGEECKWVAND